MILDLENKTVTLPAGGTLTVTQLWGILDVLDPDLEADVHLMLTDQVEFSAHDPEKGRIDIRPIRVYHVESDRRDHLYAVVSFTDGSWACSCPDWRYRRAPWLEADANKIIEPGTPCKHVKHAMFPWLF